ncbi:CLUMA_CG017473, isoform A [Clunio marinus]|uniref:CLUMA_CG017473, isoform A n=1 Tax=Clunio marinus TaxID=568069 RepID=A0A1J1IYZ0_9DIPT|nr:CLUMA_CG017473, isoform A [Clunio marinus]
MTSNISFNDTFDVVKFQEQILRNKCRLCLKPVNSETDKIQLTEKFKDMIHNILQIRLISSSIASNFICQICRSQVNDFYLFKRKMNDQQNLLKNFLVVDDFIDFKTDLDTTLNETETNENMLTENTKKYDTLEQRLKKSLAANDTTTDFEGTDFNTDLSTILNETETNDSMLTENSKKYDKILKRFEESLAANDSTTDFDETEFNPDLGTTLNETETNCSLLTENSKMYNKLLKRFEDSLAANDSTTDFDETDFNTDLGTTLNETDTNDSMLTDISKENDKLMEKEFHLNKSLALNSITDFDETDLNTDLSTTLIETEISMSSTILKPNKNSISNIQLEDSLMEIEIETNKSKNMDDEKEIGDAQKIHCKTCGKLLKRKSLKRHILRIHKIEKKPSVCKICGKDLKSQFSLKMHMKKVHDKPFECDICGKKFFNKGAISEHLMSHVPEEFQIKQYKCQLCGLSYHRRGSLNYHLSTHKEKNKEKTVQCVGPGCTKMYYNRSNMMHHYRNHCENKKTIHKTNSINWQLSNINCPVGSCEYSGSRKHHVKAHFLRMHSNLSRDALENYISQI